MMNLLGESVIAVNRRRRRKTREWTDCWTFFYVEMTSCCRCSVTCWQPQDNHTSCRYWRKTVWLSAYCIISNINC